MNILRFNNMELTDGAIYSRSQIKNIANNSKVSNEEKCAVLYQLGSIYSDKIIAKKVDDEYLKDLNIKTDKYGNEYIPVNLKLINYMYSHKIIKYVNALTPVFNIEYLREMLFDDYMSASNITEHLNFCLILNEIDKKTGVDNWLVKALLVNINIVTVANIDGIDKITDKIIYAIRNNKHKKYLKLTEKYPDKIYNNLNYMDIAFKANARLIFQDLALHYVKPIIVDEFKAKYPEMYKELIKHNRI